MHHHYPNSSHPHDLGEPTPQWTQALRNRISTNDTEAVTQISAFLSTKQDITTLEYLLVSLNIQPWPPAVIGPLQGAGISLVPGIVYYLLRAAIDTLKNNVRVQYMNPRTTWKAPDMRDPRWNQIQRFNDSNPQDFPRMDHFYRPDWRDNRNPNEQYQFGDFPNYGPHVGTPRPDSNPYGANPFDEGTRTVSMTQLYGAINIITQNMNNMLKAMEELNQRIDGLEHPPETGPAESSPGEQFPSASPQDREARDRDATAQGPSPELNPRFPDGGNTQSSENS